MYNKLYKQESLKKNWEKNIRVLLQPAYTTQKLHASNSTELSVTICILVDIEDFLWPPALRITNCML